MIQVALRVNPEKPILLQTQIAMIKQKRNFHLNITSNLKRKKNTLIEFLIENT